MDCQCGNRHWGFFGAAGLFLVRLDEHGQPTDVVLQHRALWSHHGGTWGIPGGAIMEHETPVQGALREATEEAGIDSTAVEVLTTHVFAHPDWSYTTAIAVTRRTDLEVSATDMESLEVEWVPLSNITSDTPDRELLPSFARSLSTVLAMLHEHLPVSR